MSSLGGIEQFENVKTLDLSFNKIHDVNQLVCLKALRKLVNLTLKGNPVTLLDNYHSAVLSHCKSLNYLDGKHLRHNPEQELDEHLIQDMFNKYCQLLVFMQYD